MYVGKDTCMHVRNGGSEDSATVSSDPLAVLLQVKNVVPIARVLSDVRNHRNHGILAISVFQRNLGA